MVLRYALAFFALLSIVDVHSQAGDEDRQMFNKGKERDQKAIDEAINGWWTASMKLHDQRIQWWKEAKFGMFIHWGVYSLPGGEWKGKRISGYAEHLMRKEKITRQEYLELAHQFNPFNFNAEQWILYAKNAGMKYFVITAKHHDGFAMYDSKVSPFDLGDQTAFEHDPLGELAAAAKKHGIKFGFYYSHAFDWEHPDAPGNDWEFNNPGGDKNLFGGRDWYDLHPELLPKAQKYVTEKAIPQIIELIKKYHPDILWFDTPQKLPLSENIRILKAIREADSMVVVNGRLVRTGSVNFGDYINTADRPAEFFPVNSNNWEAIPTTNESYGYHKYDNSHKPVSHFIRLIASAASRGGNLLMNIGPRGDGSFDPKDLAILKGIGAWLQKNGESIYDAKASPLPLQSWGVITAKENKLYLHVFDRPADAKLYVGGFKSPAKDIYRKAYVLGSKQNLDIKAAGEKDLVIDISKVPIDTLPTVVVVELNNKPGSDGIRVIEDNIPVTRLLAFDARQEGKGFSFGDGKADRYYVENWKSNNQQLSWQFRTLHPTKYKLVIKYIASAETSGGSYKLSIADQLIEKQVKTDPKGVIQTEELTTVSLMPGIYTLTITPLEISKTELMKLLEIQLIPEKK